MGSGVFKKSRNPLYVSCVVVALGTAFALGVPLGFISPVVLFAILNFWIIPKEEQLLATKFGTAYATYKDEVRRWV